MKISALHFCSNMLPLSCTNNMLVDNALIRVIVFVRVFSQGKKRGTINEQLVESIDL